MSEEFTLYNLDLYTDEVVNIINAAIYFNSMNYISKGWISRLMQAERTDKESPNGAVQLRLRNFTSDDKQLNSIVRLPELAEIVKEMILHAVFYSKVKDFSDNPGKGFIHQFIRHTKRYSHNNNTLVYASASTFDENNIRVIEHERVPFTLKNAWIVYDVLAQEDRQKMIKKYGQDAIDKVVGHPRNPMAVEQLKIAYDEITKLEQEFRNWHSDMTNKMNNEIEKIRTATIKQIEERRAFLKQQTDSIKAQFKGYIGE